MSFAPGFHRGSAPPTLPLLWLAAALSFATAGPAGADPGEEPSPPGEASGSEPNDLDALAAYTSEMVETADWSPERVLAYLEVGRPDDCLHFDAAQTLRRRTERWRHAIAVLARSHPDFLDDWVTGRRRPPRAVRREARFQRNCLLDAMVERARSAPDALNLDIPDDADKWISSRAKRRRSIRRYHHHPGIRRRVRAAITQSLHRSAAAQSYIWRRKYLFRRAPFHAVSAAAARRCGLEAGRLWDPARRVHRRCWRRTLSEEQREREILQASSAPGISRHHWGTESDLFSLSAAPFYSGRLQGEFRWLKTNALRFGYFQPYQNEPGRNGYMAEPWHWSYLPVARALTDYAAGHTGRVQQRLVALWTQLNRRYRRRTGQQTDYFDHIREHWKVYVFGLSAPRWEIFDREVALGSG